MRVFVDTNVLVSAVATRGLSADVLRLVLAEHELVTGEVVLAELRRVLSGKFGLPDRRIVELETFLRRHHVEPFSDQHPAVKVRDPDDVHALGSAMSANADILITGDKDLLQIRDRIDAPVITDPRGFWEMVRRKT